MTDRKLRRAVQFIFDLACLFCAWQVAVQFARFALPLLGVAGRRESGLPPVWSVILVWSFISLWAGSFRALEKGDRWDRMREALHAGITVVFTVMITSFFTLETQPATPLSRGCELLLLFFVFTALRLATPGGATGLSKRWSRRGGVAVLGFDEEAVSVLEHLRYSETDRIRGLIVPEGRMVKNPAGTVPVLGTTGNLAEVINREKLDRIVLLTGSLSERELESCSAISSRMGVTMSYTVAVATAQNLNYSVYYGIPLLEIEPVRFTAAERLLKRGFDIVVSSLSLVVLAPVMVLIAFLIKATSEGPILFTAARVGRGGRYFTFLKFRSMFMDSSRTEVKASNEKDGHLFKIMNDPRVTPIGRILRRYSLDELPQLINVLIGDMSMIGPRPLPIEDMDPSGMSSRFAIWSEQRASVPPGITGLWQIRGRSTLPFSDLIKYDLEYIHNWSLSLDLKILLKTPLFVLSGTGAY